MMNADFYNLTQLIQGNLFAAMQTCHADHVAKAEPPPPLLQIRRGYAESPGWFLIQAAEFDPEPLTVENLRIRDIYASERIVQALLEMLAGERWLERRGERYYLTTAGQALIQRLKTRTANLLSLPLPKIPQETIHTIEKDLGHIINLSIKHDSHPEAWCLIHSRNRAPVATASPLEKISQYCADFNAFRDDAHMAAWQTEQVDGYVWEAFNLVHSRQTTNAQEIFETLFYRGYSQEEYAGALQTLTELGWLTTQATDSHNYQVSELGQTIRNRVETKTDAYFYAPWKALSQEMVDETQTRLQHWNDSLKTLSASNH
ncbi:MAG: hypothetical protein AAF629_30935 [Chloroflexota bacterium]